MYIFIDLFVYIICIWSYLYVLYIYIQLYIYTAIYTQLYIYNCIYIRKHWKASLGPIRIDESYCTRCWTDCIWWSLHCKAQQGSPTTRRNVPALYISGWNSLRTQAKDAWRWLNLIHGYHMGVPKFPNCPNAWDYMGICQTWGLPTNTDHSRGLWRSRSLDIPVNALSILLQRDRPETITCCQKWSKLECLTALNIRENRTKHDHGSRHLESRTTSPICKVLGSCSIWHRFWFDCPTFLSEAGSAFDFHVPARLLVPLSDRRWAPHDSNRKLGKLWASDSIFNTIQPYSTHINQKIPDSVGQLMCTG